MAKSISIFNNKGGVGKTTYMYHIANLLARDGLTVLMVDCDPQCNLTSYSMRDSAVRHAWRDTGNSIFQNILPVYRTTGDIRNRMPTKVRSEYELYLVPGDMRLSDFEDRLGDTWNSAKGGSEPDLRAQSAIHRYIEFASASVDADLVLIDLGPNLGALNRATLASSDYFITPVAPDLFSIQGTENLGNKLVGWRREWNQCNAAWTGGASLSIPTGRPSYLGYVVQMHNQRSTGASGMTAGWRIYGSRLEPAIRANIVAKLPSDQVVSWEDEIYKLGQIPNLHSLIPYSLNARLPVYDLRSAHGLTGAHIKTAAESDEHFEQIVQTLKNVSAWT